MLLLHSALALTGALALIAVLAQLFGALAARLGQPAICGQLAGAAAVGLLTPASFGSRMTAERLDWVGQVGIALYLMHVGAQLQAPSSRSWVRPVVEVCAAVLTACVALAAVALQWRPALAGAGDQLSGALVLGAIAVAGGLPVIARMLQERDALAHPDVWLALMCSTALMALSLGLGQAALMVHEGASPIQVLGRLAALAALIAAASPTSRSSRSGPAVWAGTSLSLAALSWAAFGNVYLGCLAAGLAVPRASKAITKALARLERPLALVLIPTFLAGAAASLSPAALAALPAGLAVAAALQGGRLLSTTAVLRRRGDRAAASTAVAVSCSGVLGLAVATQGVRHGVGSAQLIAAAFVLAVVSTAATWPALARVGALRSAAAAGGPA